MRVLVTGAAGFLGSHLTDALLADGNSVLGADNLCTGSLENLQHLQREPRFEFQEQDICDRSIRSTWITCSTSLLLPVLKTTFVWASKP